LCTDDKEDEDEDKEKDKDSVFFACIELDHDTSLSFRFHITRMTKELSDFCQPRFVIRVM